MMHSHWMRQVNADGIGNSADADDDNGVADTDVFH